MVWLVKWASWCLHLSSSFRISHNSYAYFAICTWFDFGVRTKFFVLYLCKCQRFVFLHSTIYLMWAKNSPTLMRIRSRYQKVPVSQSHANTERPRNGNEEKCNRITGYNRRGNEMCRVQSFRWVVYETGCELGIVTFLLSHVKWFQRNAK